MHALRAYIFATLLASLSLAQLLYPDEAVLAPDWSFQDRTVGLHDHNDTKPSHAGCIAACRLLERVIPQFRTYSDPADYAKEHYWSTRQGELVPRCFIQPSTPKEIALILVTVGRNNCSFAVTGGGHAAFPGGSNIQDGLTVDLRRFNELSLVEEDDSTVLRVGAGNRWGDVYDYLLLKQLAVLGASAGDVGVGGFILGGGISFLSPRHGWAVDSVRNYELVTSRGYIVQVNQESQPDLYWALRGGGTNFGIVTRFDLETFPQKSMWGGVTYSDRQHTDEVINALVAFAFHAPHDLDAHASVFFDFTRDRDHLRIGSVLAYAGATEFHEALTNFTSIPTVQSSLRTTDVADLARETSASNSEKARTSYSTVTFRANREIMREVVGIFIEEAETIKHLDGIAPAVELRLLALTTISRFSRNGGNCLEIEESEGPLIITNFSFRWANAADDKLVLRAARRMRERTSQRARELGVIHRYLNLNYADADQDVFASYGEENLERLREISRMYDPEQVFQRLQPGYFKL